MGHSKRVLDVAFHSSQDTVLLSASADKTAVVWKNDGQKGNAPLCFPTAFSLLSSSSSTFFFFFSSSCSSSSFSFSFVFFFFFLLLLILLLLLLLLSFSSCLLFSFAFLNDLRVCLTCVFGLGCSVSSVGDCGGAQRRGDGCVGARHRRSLRHGLARSLVGHSRSSRRGKDAGARSQRRGRYMANTTSHFLSFRWNFRLIWFRFVSFGLLTHSGGGGGGGGMRALQRCV